nr:B3 domain-containing protein At1g49475-like [Tanacetum cinerariifolium]
SAVCILNMVPTKKVDKTPYEIWHSKAPNLFYLKVRGCEAYVKRDSADKLQQRSVKCIFVGYTKEIMGYYFYFSPENKVIVARYGDYLERDLISQKLSGRDYDLEDDNMDTLPSENTSEIPVEPESLGPPLELIPVHRSERTTRASNRLCLNMKVEDDEVEDLGEPANYKTVLLDPDKVVRNKWLYKKKTDMDGKVHTNKARLVAKSCTQIFGIDYQKTFSPVADIGAIRILIAIAAYYDYEIWQMDVKTAFLNGRLDEDIYMEQPEGYVDPKYPNGVCKLQRAIFGLKQASRQWNKRFDEESKEVKHDLSNEMRASSDEEKAYMKKVPYASAVGSIMYAVRCTRPDVAFAQNLVSRYQQNSRKLHWVAVKRILKYLRNTKDMFLVYGGNPDTELEPVEFRNEQLFVEPHVWIADPLFAKKAHDEGVHKGDATAEECILGLAGNVNPFALTVASHDNRDVYSQKNTLPVAYFVEDTQNLAFALSNSQLNYSLIDHNTVLLLCTLNEKTVIAIFLSHCNHVCLALSPVFDETEIFFVMKSPVVTHDESPEDSMWIDLGQSPIGSPSSVMPLPPPFWFTRKDRNNNVKKVETFEVKTHSPEIQEEYEAESSFRVLGRRVSFGLDDKNDFISDEEYYESDRKEPEVTCRHLDHVNMLGLSKTTFRLRFLINWLVTSLLQLRLPSSNTEDVVPLVHIYGPKIKYERGAAVAFNVRDRITGLISPDIIQRMAEANGLSLGVAILSHSKMPLSLPENQLNFLIIILSNDPRSTGKLPKKFTEKHGNDLLERVTLKIPNNDVWKVDLKKSKGEIWLSNGWSEFVEHYGLKFGHLLVFKYEGSSTFGVVIFEPSASEIVYPKKTIKDDARKSQVTCDKLKSVKSEDETSSSWSEDRNHGIRINDEGECSKKSERYPTKKERIVAVEKAKANFKCDKPFFMAYVHKSTLTKGVRQSAPEEFRKTLFKGMKRRRCLLQLKNDARQKTWAVVAQNKYMGSAEWKMFVEDNGITVGDICVFELMHKDANVLGVTILRSAS